MWKNLKNFSNFWIFVMGMIWHSNLGNVEKHHRSVEDGFELRSRFRDPVRSTSRNNQSWIVWSFQYPAFMSFSLSSVANSLSFSMSQTAQHLCTVSTSLKMVRSQKNPSVKIISGNLRSTGAFAISRLVQNVSRGQIGCKVAHTTAD